MARNVRQFWNALLVAFGATGNATHIQDFEDKLVTAVTNLGVGSVTAGTVSASKQVVVDSNKDISGFRNVSVGGTLTSTGAITPTGGIAAAGGFTLKPLAATGENPAMASTDGTDTTPVITEFYYAQVNLRGNSTLTGVANFNGSVASGNIKVGLADSSGNILATSASTAMSGTDTYQKVAFTSPYSAVGPATYYVLLFVDNTTARFNTHSVGAFNTGKVTGQVYATGFTAFTPASTFTASLGPIATLY